MSFSQNGGGKGGFITTEEGKELGRSIGASKFIEISALQYENVDACFKACATVGYAYAKFAMPLRLAKDHANERSQGQCCGCVVV